MSFWCQNRVSLEKVKKGENGLFWGHILAKKGPFGPKWAEFPYSSKGKLLAQIQPLRAPI